MRNENANHRCLTPPVSDSPKSVVVDDATLRQLYDRLRMSEAQLRLAAEAAGAGLWSLNLETRVLHINRNVRDLFCFDDDEEIAFDQLLAKIHPDDLPGIQEMVHGLPEKREATCIEYRIVLPDGSVRWIHSRGVLHDDDSTCLMGALTDITERKASEAAYIQQFAFESLMAEISASFALFMLPSDVDERIEHALSRVLDFFGGDRCGVIIVNLEKKHTTISHAFYRKGFERLPVDMDLVPLFPWSFSQVREERPTTFSRLDELPPEAETDRRSWMALGVCSGLQVPLRVQDSIHYLIIVQSLTTPVSWNQASMSRLKIVGDLFVNVIQRKRVEAELRNSCDEIAKLRDKLEVEADYLRSEVRASRFNDQIVGQSEPIRQVLAMVEQVAPTPSTVLVCGETGTGKELVAQAIHNHSPRRDKLMVKVNCASLPSSLIESELFGRERGAYTGALTRQMGRFELADGSSLFLDEISELSLELQAKLLRVLQEGEFERLGSPRTLKVDVRVIAATNRNLLEEVKKGRFREDLYYRLNVFPIVVPPLRERLDDIPLLVWEFIRDFNEKMGKRIRRVAKREMFALQSYAWPGNIRELRNVIEYGVIVSSGDELKVRLPEESITPCGKVSLEEMERRYIEEILRQTDWRIKGEGGAAQILDINPATLYSRMKKLGILPPREKDGIPSSS
jgi:PAS domain S-box-containing protein